MDDKLKSTFGQLMYAMTKTCARESWIEFLDDWGIEHEEYEGLKEYLEKQYGVKTYV